MIRPGLRHNGTTHHRYSIQLHAAIFVFGSQLGPANILKTNHTPAIFLNNQVIKLFRPRHQSEGPNRKLHGVPFNFTGRQLHILASDCSTHIHRSYPACSHLNRIEPKTHGVALLSPDHHRTDSGDGLQLLLKGKFGNLRQIEHVPLIARNSKHQNGRGIGVIFFDGWGIHIAWQKTLRLRNLLTDIVSSRFHIDLEFELHHDSAASLATNTGERANSGNPVNRLFERFGKLIFDDIRIGPGVRGSYRNNGLIHIGKLPYPQIGHPQKPENQNHQIQHRGQNRPLNTDR